MRRKNWVWAGLVAVLLAACTEAPYVPADSSRRIAGGYRDIQVGPDRYHIEIDGSGRTSEATMAQYFHRRARELCGSSKYAYHYEFEQPDAARDSHRHSAFTARNRPRVLAGEATCAN